MGRHRRSGGLVGDMNATTAIGDGKKLAVQVGVAYGMDYYLFKREKEFSWKHVGIIAGEVIVGDILSNLVSGKAMLNL